MPPQNRKARETSSCFRTVLCLSFSVDVSFLKLVSPQSLCTAAPSPPPLKIGKKNSLPNFVWGEVAAVSRLLATLSLPFAYIRRFRKEKGNVVELPPAIFFFGIVTGDAPVSYWPNVNSPTSLCDGYLGPVSLSFLKWRQKISHHFLWILFPCRLLATFPS